MSVESTAEEEFLEALTALEDVLDDQRRRAGLIKKRIVQIRRRRAKGASYIEIVSSNETPLIVQLLTESSIALDTCGADVRRAEARALYDEGLTMEQIAERFGGREHTRGYRQGRYRDRILLAAQVEYRVDVIGRFGLAAFAGLGDVAPGFRSFEFEHARR